MFGRWYGFVRWGLLVMLIFRVVVGVGYGVCIEEVFIVLVFVVIKIVLGDSCSRREEREVVRYG